jgi:hypothetical protein
MLVALAVLFMLALVGIASIRTSTIDMDISRANYNKTKSFYIADGGLGLAVGTMRANPKIVDADSILDIVDDDTTLGIGWFHIDMNNTYPFRTITCTGHDVESESAVAVDMRHRRVNNNAWDNAVFAGTGQAGKGIAGNVDFHGSVHILGEGEPFTDLNANDKWDDEDQFTDLSGDGLWQPGEPLTTDSDGDGLWDPAEPYTDETGNGSYDQTLTATDLSFEAAGTAAVQNNYNGMNAVLADRVVAPPQLPFNGENVYTLDAEMRVKHGMVSLSGTATAGDPNVSGGSPAVKETLDGVYVNDGFGGTGSTANVYSDNGTTETYDLRDEDVDFPSLNDTSNGYISHNAYLVANAAVVAGDLTLEPGTSYTSPANPNGSITVDAAGNITITGIVMVTGNIYINAGKAGLKNTPFVYDGRGTLVSGGDMVINTHVISKDKFPTEDVMGFLACKNMEIGTGVGASQLNLIGAFYAQQQITNTKQNSIAGALVSNYFSVTNVPSIFQVPSLVDNLPPGMPGSGTVTRYVWRELGSTWRELD